ncbi:electron transfer flavoprotein subunit alpha/FixB family protein [Promineifilum sp.]|uniref:electron transfer flavoprotein subunit alpha/FixB family protein n=1 Tax=Promineifilum sp. TaxID=2664178 RepID=UPI0035B3E824
MILCLVEHTQREPNPFSLEALALGRQMAGQVGAPLAAVVVGAAGRPAAEALREYGAADVHLIADERLDAYAPEAWAESVAGLIDDLGPQAVIAAGSDRGHEVMAHVAAITNLALATNCLSVEPGEAFLVTRQRWGGSLLEEARLKGPVKLLTIAPNVFAAALAPAATFAIHETRPALTDNAFRVMATQAAAADAGRLSLADARLVIGGGRGVGSAEGFRALEELAGLLGAAVGCSRAVTSAGWRPHAEQIGQTGERITAELYIACGISGAMQHIVGAEGARHILAINTDPDATIMNYADYAIIGDLHQIVPAIVAELKRAKGL